ncbi:hypothetical protein [uncultured Mediterranean phage uvMED]|jgi:hypothetical protein|nr:hypothetical protein [uncultured Mediterranean phage uvMED]BAQ91114.1 hypothetical protein [uncultured Mediterranean phage uvMED]BAQ91149.1 hypothetical protein [uncultured Mediterranean phage uvMED]BAQ91211.1 hypothetical protein [uncultured Mediterranean phage uvMED]|tara:strand:+ start:47 stop:370 length:324 start_codon:yes stop_codon:yes gene_type:complete
MRIPTNSNFSTEIAKKFKQIFHRDMTLGGLQDLQEQSDLSYNPIYINPVDSYLVNQVIQLKEKANGQETSKVANAVRQIHNEGKGFVTKTVSNKGKEKSSSLEITSS